MTNTELPICTLSEIRDPSRTRTREHGLAGVDSVARNGASALWMYFPSACSVHAGSVVDAQHDDDVEIVVDLVDHAVGAATGRVQPDEFTL